MPAPLSLSRMLAAAQATNHDQMVVLKRDGEGVAVGRVGRIVSGEIDDIVLQPDDEIVLTATN